MVETTATGRWCRRMRGNFNSTSLACTASPVVAVCSVQRVARRDRTHRMLQRMIPLSCYARTRLPPSPKNRRGRRHPSLRSAVTSPDSLKFQAQASRLGPRSDSCSSLPNRTDRTMTDAPTGLIRVYGNYLPDDAPVAFRMVRYSSEDRYLVTATIWIRDTHPDAGVPTPRPCLCGCGRPAHRWDGTRGDAGWKECASCSCARYRPDWPTDRLRESVNSASLHPREPDE